MASGTVDFGHDGFQERINNLVSFGLDIKGAAENVAFNKGFDDPAAQACEGWFASPGHETNIVGDYTHAAIGIAEKDDGTIYFTQIFIKL